MPQSRFLLAVASLLVEGCQYKPVQVLLPDENTVPAAREWFVPAGTFHPGVLNGSGSGGGVSNSDATTKSPAILRDGEGATVVAWIEDTPGGPRVFLRIWGDGGWSEVDGSASGDGLSVGAVEPRDVVLAKPKGQDITSGFVVAWTDRPSTARVVLLRAFLPPATLGPTIECAGAAPLSVPDVAVGSSGVPFIVSRAAGPGGMSLEVHRLDNGMCEPVGVRPNPDFIATTDANPAIDVFGTDGVLIAWEEPDMMTGTPYISVRRWDGANWVELTAGALRPTTDPAFGANARDPDIIVDNGGREVVAWAQDGIPSLVHARAFDAGSWVLMGQTSALNQRSAAKPKLQAVGANIHIAWLRNVGTRGELIARSYFAGDSRWTTANGTITEGIVTVSQPGTAFDFAADPGRDRETLAMAWLDDRNGTDAVYARVYDSCLAVWNDLVPGAGEGVSQGYACSEYPTVKVGVDLTPHVTWSSWQLPFPEVHLARPMGQDWGGIQGSASVGGVSDSSLLGLAQSSGYPRMALDSLGRPHVTWHEFRSSTWHIFLEAYDDAAWVGIGGSNSDEGISDGPTALFPAITIGPGDETWVFWQEGAEVHSAFLDDGDWSLEGRVRAAGAGGGLSEYYYRVDAASRMDGTPVVAMTRFVSGITHVVVLHRDAGVWQPLGGDAFGVITSDFPDEVRAAIAVDDQDRPIVVWAGVGPGQTSNVYGLRYDGARWLEMNNSGSGLGISDSTEGAYEPDVTVGPSGEPVVVWTEAHDSGFQIYLRHLEGDQWQGIDGSESGTGLSRTGSPSRWGSVDHRGGRICVSWTDSGVETPRVLLRCVEL